ncbi:hypothetical protein [Dictyobacter aurantiacus]|uniref:Mannose-6-phosphate isomerase n=1 Tax=Dictyobacter aurantiacus TaxID=1936993 RepID=A0A401ZMH6_9CHLR|nr:hypothetical protein [Dictyobacter aurantiacus]GCE08069.1 hypothetical protein KDAU_53980 [Dictyobacter aurantiacus]
MTTDQQSLQLARQAFEEGDGIVRLTPTWVPRVFCIPGRRLRLHPDDLYAFGARRGGIDERWLASTVHADNGPLTSEDEGLSFIAVAGQKVLLRDALDLLGKEVLGEEAIERYGGWVMFSKFFDNMQPLPFHLHQNDERAADVGRVGKPEAYYFPAQYNFSLNAFPYTFFGLEPGTTKDQVVACLKRWNEGDNGILQLSKAYRLSTGTGWDVPTGILHAPGTLCTYEPQRASDVSSMWQSLISDSQIIDRSMLVKDVPENKWEDYDYLLSLLDWEGNVDPQFKERRFHTPIEARPVEEMRDAGYDERWIVYGSEFFSAKEVTLQPGRSVTLRDAGAYGLICVQGYGRIGPHPISAPSLIRFGELTEDEFFVSRPAAQQGVTLTNHSSSEPLVILKHFNPGNPEMPRP